MYDRFSKIFPYAPVILLIGCFSFFLSDLNAQSDSCRFLIKIENYKNYSSFRFTKKIKDTFSFSDFRLQIRDIKSELNESGYFNASFSQSEDCTNDFCIILINPGKRYEWTILKNGLILQ